MCTWIMLTEKWGTASLRRCRLRSGLAAAATIFAGVLLLPSSAAAQAIPPGCTANEFDVTPVALGGAATEGETVTFLVFVENTTQIGQAGCNVTNVTFDFICPDGTTTNVVTNATYPFPTAPFLAGTFQCVMPSDVEAAIARVEGTYVLRGVVPSPNIIDKTVSVAINECAVRVDKQVSCNGGTTWVDVGAAADDVTQFCIGVNDVSQIRVRHQVENIGETSLFQCTLNESNTLFNVAPGTVVNTLPLIAGASTPFLPGPGQPLCSNALDALEPNTATVSCFCTAGLNPDLKASADDTANIECVSPRLSVIKQCPNPNSDATAEVQISVANPGNVALTNCQVTDTVFLDDPTCPAGPAGGTSVTLAPAGNFNLAPGGNQPLTGTVTLDADACNTVSVSCTVAGTGVTVTGRDDAVCPGPGKGCLTRTPGFWGNHPAITAQFLDVEVCGVTLDTTASGDTSSATEAICSVGRDGQILGSQRTQLVRQCTAAALNIAASTEGGGSCSTEFPNLTAQFAACCGDVSVCTDDDASSQQITSCIERLDAFNNSTDTLEPFGDFLSPGPANSAICRDARNNNVVVTPDFQP